ncbi:hypothetical protein EJ02DRAFT_344350, partial [Clathrospora elynae]
ITKLEEEALVQHILNKLLRRTPPLKAHAQDIADRLLREHGRKPGQVTNTDAGTAIDSVKELMVIHMLHGLAKVNPQWVEDGSNDLCKGQSWTIDALIASVEDDIRHSRPLPLLLSSRRRSAYSLALSNSNPALKDLVLPRHIASTARRSMLEAQQAAGNYTLSKSRSA